MTFVIATILFPALVAVLALGTGLLIDRVAGGAVPGALLVPLGLGGLVVVAELFAWQSATGSLTPVALLVCGIAGFAVGFPRLASLRPNWWLIAASLGAYVALCAPVLLSGHVTMAGYLLDTTVGFHLLGSDYLLDHGRDFGQLPVTTYRMTLEAYFGTQYPSGGHTLLGGAGRLVGTDRIWLYQPFLSLLLACCVPTLYWIARKAAVARPIAAAGAMLATIPALVYSYAEMGAIKEVTALPFVLLLGALLVLLPRLVALGLPGAIVPGVVAAAGVGAIGLAFAPWLALAGLAGLGLLLFESRDRRALVRPLAAWTGVLAVAVVLLALPTFGPLSDSLKLTKSFSTSNAGAVADPGNLLRPLKNEQMLGVWLAGGHRGDPTGEWFQRTYLLIGVAALAALLGLVFLVRRRLWTLAAWVVASAIVWALLTKRGTAWTDAKLLVLTSPVVVLLALFGVQSLWRARRQVEAAAVGVALAAGILLSNAFVYHDTNLLPNQRYEELIDIGQRFGNGKATLLPEFDELALYSLQDLPPDGPGFSYKNPQLGTLVDGTPAAYGSSHDLDELPPQAVETYDTIVARQRPDASRPPASFERIFQGRFYDVWRKRGDSELVAHIPAGGGLEAAGRVKCGELRRAISAAGPGVTMEYVERPRLPVVNPVKAKRSPGWAETVGGVGLYTPGELTASVQIPQAGRYRVWLKGEFGRELRVFVNGRDVGALSYQSGNEGNYGTPMEADLEAGRNRVRIVRGGGSLRPGDNMPGALRAIVFEPVGVRTDVRTAPPGDWRRLCDRTVDWVELVRRT
jgi:hypothetical protein